MSDDLFDGLKMLDVGSWVADPVAGTIHVDYGVDVIKIEMLEVGDAYRNLLIRPSCRMPQQIICGIWMRVISKALR